MPLSDQVLPLYQVIKQQISDAILLERWPAGTVLHNEIELARSCGVAVGTVRRAMSDLTKEGLLIRRRKTGTIVTGRTPQQSLRFFFQYFRLHGLDGGLQYSTARVLKLEQRLPVEVERTALDIDADEPVIAIHRLRMIEDAPVMIDLIAMPATGLPDFPDDPAELPDHLYLHLLDRYGIRISAIREQIHANLANDEDASLLDLEGPATLLCIDEIAYDQAGAAMIHARHRCRTDKHRYVNEVQ
ncbi:GntR family transcriptional regulator [Breoghania sp.]|uniref:GntR family transcriptional regulator n=1 Tax=Breoghania sp. TaxID=2065378 RepID=UPI00261EB03C|nr:GntR family transcriptional regulator [Breoghania sp.]MDJ0932748.1 GntR family transcriptional regulator [Breoghania sp.]